jgi:hypothetical protein
MQSGIRQRRLECLLFGIHLPRNCLSRGSLVSFPVKGINILGANVAEKQGRIIGSEG